MKHKTWFRLILKAIGILLLAFGVPDLIAYINNYIVQRVYMQNIGTPYGGIQPEWLAVLLHILAPFLQVLIGLYLLLDGKWLLERIIPSNRPYCPNCGYDLSESGQPQACSECGVELPHIMQHE